MIFAPDRWILSLGQTPPADIFARLEARPGWLDNYAYVLGVELDPSLRATIKENSHDLVGVLFGDNTPDFIIHVDGEWMVAMSNPWPLYFIEHWADQLVAQYESRDPNQLRGAPNG
ncbi:unannotated protein [freshwater metagenome]|uniref:Unannotated protein n=1 Tax=freshwater metagenome TaxID=449393 RepID=A0A6J6T4U9_9ZZZZ|nr:hypothetical protein [Actinomycetota bacterium]